MKSDTSQLYALEVRNLTVAYNNTPVLWNVSVSVPQGILLAIVGPNGAGKTTFIKSILGLIKPIAGNVTIFGRCFSYNYREIAYVPQRSTVDWDFPVNLLDMVLMGRYSHCGWIRRPRREDVDKAWQSLELVGLTAYAHRPIGQLSGGQQQRGFLARALVQDARMYLLDEPFIGVDIATEKIMVTLLKKLRGQGKTILVVHHDLQTLHEYFDWALLLNRTCVALGPVDTVLVPEYVCAAYGGQSILHTKNRAMQNNDT